MSAFDPPMGPLAAMTVEGAQVSGNGAVVFSTSSDVAGGESSSGDGVYGAIGVGGMPLLPDSDGAAEVICARASDSLPVIAGRDLRIEKALASPPAQGTVYLAGYHGAVLRFDRPSAGTSTATLRDSTGKALVIDSQGVRVPAAALIQGDPNVAQDVLLAQTAIDLLTQIGPAMLAAMTAINGLAPGTFPPTQIAQLTTALAPFLVPASGPTPAAPTTRAPGVRGAPGA